MYPQLICFLLIISLTLAQFPHPAVIENAAQEELLPPQLKNPFYRTPRVRALLERHSWFGPGERPVEQRAAESIPRAEIYAVLTHAGLVPRRFHNN